MRLPFGVVLRTSWEIMHAAVDLDRDARFSHREIHCETPDLVLTHHVNAVRAQLAQRFPCPLFRARRHAVAVFAVA
jgi:hypothetical protein